MVDVSKLAVTLIRVIYTIMREKSKKQTLATNPSKPSPSLVKSICYPDHMNRFTKAACKYGFQHEEIAWNEYANKMSKIHANFEISKSGLIIHLMYPFMGASPDDC